MKSSLYALALAGPAAVLAFCKNDEFDFVAPKINNTVARRHLNSLGKRDLIPVAMYTHIMTAAPPTEDFGPSLQAQRDFINKNFEPWGFQFVDVRTTYYFNADWAANAEADREAKTAYARRGDYASLNVYLVEGETAGFCYFPTDPAGGPVDQKTLNDDGCYVGIKDGRSEAGGTLTHEIGHWLGLPHVFEGGCAGTDGCDDTVPQAEPGRGVMAIPGDVNSCLAGAKESCTPGIKDNIKNFMDYTDCSSEFTPCQGGRMMEAWSWRMGRQFAEGVQPNLS